ncbi:rhomboid family intramembrane serine protease [Caulobacter sp. S45]|uniref:rhomboid family intramembrane serine protease n=1 Tax=Caulobacter sp. S45 TaxID=1641861 RepID=UPI00157704A1|nr:rhomboid family intramembrane serine protease [Caulobacter sp. S45]
MTTPRPAAEPLFNAPAAVLVVVASIVGGYLLQSLSPDPDVVIAALGLVPLQVAQGQVWSLLTVMVVHASWAHALLNALGALAFGTPVARWFGRGQAWRFFAFYLVCGLLSSLGYVLLHWGRPDVLVGASGAIAGLMGATSRLLDRRGASARGVLAPFRSRTVIGMAAAWGFINLLMALRWIDVGSGGAPVAWEAHLFGYAAGLLLIGPFSRSAPAAAPF